MQLLLQTNSHPSQYRFLLLYQLFNALFVFDYHSSQLNLVMLILGEGFFQNLKMSPTLVIHLIPISFKLDIFI